MGSISICQDDITELDVDAVVNAANNHLWMGAGVAGAIKRAGGQEIENEAVKKGPIPVGEAIVTGAGRLKAKYVIHAAAMGQDLQTDASKIRAATRNSLLRAEELRLKSVAFPALGTGVGGFSVSEAARIMIDAVRDHFAHSDFPQEVIFALRGEEAYRSFDRALHESSEPRG